MPRYQLFAAHDGDTIDHETWLPDLEAAEKWATKIIIDEFRLEQVNGQEFDDVVAETDGATLSQLPPDPVGSFLIDWLTAQAQVVEPLRRHFPGKFEAQFRSYKGGILDLLLAVQAEQ